MKHAYQQLVDTNVLCYDKAQVCAVEALALLTKQLVPSECHIKSKSSRLSYSLSLLKQIVNIPSKNKAPKGLYFYGRVGRGKTMLMDLFYQNLLITRKKRIHFYRFMESVHQQLNMLSQAKESIDNPLEKIAKRLTKDIDVLCFDEFFVNDIGDAMLLSGLLSALFSQGITLIATSNCQPEQLYSNGLQRQRFLPTIDLIHQYCQVISINGDNDHRLSHLPLREHYPNYYLQADGGEVLLATHYTELSSRTANNAGQICICHRKIDYLARDKRIIWFDFFALCSGPRSQLDYIKMADLFETVFITNVPQFSGKLVPAVFSGVEDSYQRSGVLLGDLRLLDDEARRFIALVDEFYDRKVNLVISAEVDISDLYQGQELAFEFARCQSRLFEMQSS